MSASPLGTLDLRAESLAPRKVTNSWFDMKPWRTSIARDALTITARWRMVALDSGHAFKLIRPGIPMVVLRWRILQNMIIPEP